MHRQGSFLEEFARGLDFPDYFGGNWDALEDCLRDLEWLSAEAFVLIITNAEQVLKNSPGELVTFAGILSSAAAHLSAADPPASFHLFQCEPESADDLNAGLPGGNRPRLRPPENASDALTHNNPHNIRKACHEETHSDSRAHRGDPRRRPAGLGAEERREIEDRGGKERGSRGRQDCGRQDRL